MEDLPPEIIEFMSDEEEEVVERLQLLGVEEAPRLLVQHQPAQLPPRSLPLSLLADQ